MIPFIRSFTELMLITQSRDKLTEKSKFEEIESKIEDSGQRKRYIKSKEDELVDLPNLPKKTRYNWKKSKEVVTKIFDELDYNNQIQSSYELTLQARQMNNNHQDVA